MKRDFFMDLLLNLIRLALFYGVFAMPTVVWLGYRWQTVFLVTAGLAMGLFLVRRFIKPIVPMILVHLAFLVAVWFIAPDFESGVYYQIIYLIFAIFMVFLSLYQRYRKTTALAFEYALFVSLLFVIFAFIAGNQGNNILPFQYALLIAFVFIGSRLHMRMSQVKTSLDAITDNSYNQPLKKILAFDFKTTVTLVVLLVGLVFVLHVFVIRPVLERVADALPMIEFSLLDEDAEDGRVYFHQPFDIQDFVATGNDTELAAAYTDTFILWVILERIIFVILPLLLAFMVYCIVKAMRYKKPYSPELSDGYEDIKEFISTPKKRRRRRGVAGEHRLRRLFRETVMGHMKRGVPIQKTDTPVQMAGKVLAEDFDTLAEEYAGVRYGSN